MSEYKPVPVDRAKGIALDFSKDIVIICVWDREHNLLHTTTYGVSPEDKVSAAKGGEIVAQALGMDLHKSTHYEDFRKDFDAAKARALHEAVKKHLPALQGMARQIISPTDNVFSRICNDFEAAIHPNP